jgi:uncharacterized membrane protein YhaH (DUF805 family)
MNSEKRYWFPAKRYGWGWGLPNTWQGWLVLLCWLAVILVAMPLLKASHPIACAIFIGLMVGLLLVICYLTGEPPAWRWGDRR